MEILSKELERLSNWEDALWRERVKIAPGTGTASSGVPVWEKAKIT